MSPKFQNMNMLMLYLLTSFSSKTPIVPKSIMLSHTCFVPITPLHRKTNSLLDSLRQFTPIRSRWQCKQQQQQPCKRLLPRPSNPALPQASNTTTFPSPQRPQFSRLLKLLSLLPLLRVAPSHAAVTASVATAATSALSLDPTSFSSGLAASFILVLASEIGDKTFFISALLSMKYSRALVLLGTMLALGAMTVISVGIGQLFHTLPTSLKLSVPIDDYAAVAALIWFGVQSIRDGLKMNPSSDEELQDARDVVAGKAKGVRGARVVAETTGLVFLAEWGDKSMLATVALAAAKNPIGVIVGGVTGHLIATIIAVLSGSFLGRFVSERSARLIGGVLFLVFAVLTIHGLYYPV